MQATPVNMPPAYPLPGVQPLILPATSCYLQPALLGRHRSQCFNVQFHDVLDSLLKAVWPMQVFDLAEHRPGPVLEKVWQNLQHQIAKGDAAAEYMQRCVPFKRTAPALCTHLQ